MAVSPTTEVIRFGLFELDLKAGQLSRSGHQLRLPQQPLLLLALLLERPGEILTRDELRQRLWPSDVFVDFDHGLNKSVQKIRDALGDSASSPRYIETIPRVGYRFIAPVATVDSFRSGTLVRQPAENIRIEPDAVEMQPPTVLPSAPRAGSRATARWWLAGGVIAAAVLLGTVKYLARLSSTHPAPIAYTQLTDFTDAASSPALSPDGHMLAFIRGDNPFLSADQIYVKMLPNGEARRLTNDSSVKYNVAFSPDGSQIAYSIMDNSSFSTYTVSVLGGDPHLLLKNAAGLSWLNPNEYLFSRVRSGLHLGIVTASLTGDHVHELYYPAHERGMAHYSTPSPDRHTALVVEMDGQGAWTSCKLISMEGPAQVRPVGPNAPCTAAGWSPDGAWMYFIAAADGSNHLWRQRFPKGRPEQLTFGPTEEEGLAVAPDGRSVVTSIGVHQSAIWLHDDRGERSLSSEGEVVEYYSPPTFTPDGKALYYLYRHQPVGGEPELWKMEVDSGKSEAVFQGIAMIAYDVSPDGKLVVYAADTSDGQIQLWLAPIDKSTPPRPVGPLGSNMPHFGPGGEIVFLYSEGNTNYLEKMNRDGSGRSKIMTTPVIDIQAVSPGRKWVMALVAFPEAKGAVPVAMAIPLDGGPMRRMCAGYCAPVWSPNGKFLIIPVEPSSQTNSGRSLAIPVGREESLPPIPTAGVSSSIDAHTVPGFQWLDREDLVPGIDPSHYAYVKTTSHRNLYQVSLP